MGQKIILLIMLALSPSLLLAATYDDCEIYGTCPDPTINNINQTINQTVIGGGNGTSNHDELNNLNWSVAGHIIETDFDVASNTLFVNATNNRVGINTGSPTVELDVRGANPTMLLKSNTGGVQNFLQAHSTLGGRSGTISSHPYTFYTTNTQRLYLNNNGDIIFGTSGNPIAKFVQSTENIGFYHTAPDEKVVVDGNIHLLNDNDKTYYGAGKDSSITYDGTDMVFDSQEVGSGDYIFNSGKGEFQRLLVGNGPQQSGSAQLEIVEAGAAAAFFQLVALGIGDTQYTMSVANGGGDAYTKYLIRGVSNFFSGVDNDERNYKISGTTFGNGRDFFSVGQYGGITVDLEWWDSIGQIIRANSAQTNDLWQIQDNDSNIKVFVDKDYNLDVEAQGRFDSVNATAIYGKTGIIRNDLDAPTGFIVQNNNSGNTAFSYFAAVNDLGNLGSLLMGATSTTYNASPDFVNMGFVEANNFLDGLILRTVGSDPIYVRTGFLDKIVVQPENTTIVNNTYINNGNLSVDGYVFQDHLKTDDGLGNGWFTTTENVGGLPFTFLNGASVNGALGLGMIKSGVYIYQTDPTNPNSYFYFPDATLTKNWRWWHNQSANTLILSNDDTSLPYRIVNPTNFDNDINLTGGAYYGNGSQLDLGRVHYAQLSDLVDQTYTATSTPQYINLTTFDEGYGITTSTGVNGTEIIINKAGVYDLSAQAQTAAGPGQSGAFHMWLEKYNTTAWVQVPNSNVIDTLASNDEMVLILDAKIDMAQGEKLRIGSSVSSTGIFLDYQAPSGEPNVPSIIFDIGYIGRGAN